MIFSKGKSLNFILIAALLTMGTLSGCYEADNNDEIKPQSRNLELTAAAARAVETGNAEELVVLSAKKEITTENIISAKVIFDNLAAEGTIPADAADKAKELLDSITVSIEKGIEPVKQVLESIIGEAGNFPAGGADAIGLADLSSLFSQDGQMATLDSIINLVSKIEEAQRDLADKILSGILPDGPILDFAHDVLSAAEPGLEDIDIPTAYKVAEQVNKCLELAMKGDLAALAEEVRVMAQTIQERDIALARAILILLAPDGLDSAVDQLLDVALKGVGASQTLAERIIAFFRS